MSGHAREAAWASFASASGLSAMPAPGFGGSHSSTPDAAAIMAAFAQLQQLQQSNGANDAGARQNSRSPYPPDRSGIKKCGHCQNVKPCTEFSADTSRGDGLRGWCKACEAEARSTRYKKRKAAAQAAAATRRRFETPLGGMFWDPRDGAAEQPQPSASLLQLDPALQQQLLALLALQQQQQQGASAATGPSHGSAPDSAFRQVSQRAGAPHGGADLSAGLKAAAAYAAMAAAASAGFGAAGNGIDVGSGGGSGSRQLSESPPTSDSETSALERYRKQRLGPSPRTNSGRPTAAAPCNSAAMAAAQLTLGSADAASDPAAAFTLALGAQSTRGGRNGSRHPAALAAAAAAATLAEQQCSLVHSMPPDAPLPPGEVRVPKRSRTSFASPAPPLTALPAQHPAAESGAPPKKRQMRWLPVADDAAPVAAAKAAVQMQKTGTLAAANLLPEQQQQQAEVVQWASRMMATLLVLRASEHVQQSQGHPAGARNRPTAPRQVHAGATAAPFGGPKTAADSTQAGQARRLLLPPQKPK